VTTTARGGRLFWLACLALVGCGGNDAEPSDESPPAPMAPDAPGPYPVGVTTISVESAGRTLPVEVWYPARGGGSAAEYVLQIGVLELARFQSPLSARRDGRLDRRGAPYPVVVFSHGNGGLRLQSVYLTEYLATHGFVVAAPDHVGNTFAEMVNSANAIEAAEAAKLRPGDVSRSLDAVLAASAESGGELGGAADSEHVGVAGHSFGGFTALRIAGASIDSAAVSSDCAMNGGLVCDGWDAAELPASALDARFSAALAQAPGGAQAMTAGGHPGFADVAMPVMIQGGTTDQLTPFATEQQAPYDELPSPAKLLGIEGAGHFTFSDMCLLLDQIGLSNPEFQDGCSPQNIPWPEAHAIIDRYATAFFQTTLQGLPPDPALDPATPLGTGVKLFSVK
jgi:predicted dienelactone hydrolase